jgi:FkbM family methyltransferase
LEYTLLDWLFRLARKGRLLRDPIAFERLSRHVAMNRLQNVKLINAAVSDHSGQKELIITAGLGSTLSHFRYEDEPMTNQTQTVKVPMVALDDLVADRTIEPPSLIKIDIQGHGAKAIAGGIQTITKYRPIIVFSSHSSWELHDTKAILESLGYRALNPEGNLVEWESFMHETGILTPEARINL